MVLVGVLGILVFIGIAFLLSNDKKNINWISVGTMVGLQLVATYFLLGTSIGLTVVGVIATGFDAMIAYGMVGVDFVIGGLVPEGSDVFIVNVLLIIVFTSTLLSVLTHLRILPLAIKYVGGVISKVTGLPKIESFNAVNSVFFGQSEAILAIKDHLNHMNSNRMFIVSTSAMASVSASIIGAYMTILPPKYVLVALILNMFSALIISSIVAPVKKPKQDVDIKVKNMVHTENIFDAISVGALDGGRVALIVSAMLMAYLGLLAMINGVMGSTIGIDLTTILSYGFAPIAWLMGIPWGEALQVGSIMGTKIVANEFVAMMSLQPLMDTLSAKSVGIISTFLISFGAFGSIGIISGTVQAVNERKAKQVSAFGLKLLLVATMASMVSGAVVGLFI